MAKVHDSREATYKHCRIAFGGLEWSGRVLVSQAVATGLGIALSQLASTEGNFSLDISNVHPSIVARVAEGDWDGTAPTDEEQPTVKPEPAEDSDSHEQTRIKTEPADEESYDDAGEVTPLGQTPIATPRRSARLQGRNESREASELSQTSVRKPSGADVTRTTTRAAPGLTENTQEPSKPSVSAQGTRKSSTRRKKLQERPTTARALEVDLEDDAGTQPAAGLSDDELEVTRPSGSPQNQAGFRFADDYKRKIVARNRLTRSYPSTPPSGGHSAGHRVQDTDKTRRERSGIAPLSPRHVIGAVASAGFGVAMGEAVLKNRKASSPSLSEVEDMLDVEDLIDLEASESENDTDNVSEVDPISPAAAIDDSPRALGDSDTINSAKPTKPKKLGRAAAAMRRSRMEPQTWNRMQLPH